MQERQAGVFTMDTGTFAHDRRSADRKPANIFFLIKIGRLFKARGVIKDMSEEGLCLKCPQLFKARVSIQARDFIDGALKISIPSNGITVEGSIAWVNLRLGEGAIRVTNTSDQDRWQRMFEQGV
jgi:hypothetical protein